MSVCLGKLSFASATLEIVLFAGLLFFILLRGLASAEDPWQSLRENLGNNKGSVLIHAAKGKIDPWVRLRAIYLPFTEAEETAASSDTTAGRKVFGYLHRVLKPYEASIDSASKRFNVPREIIGAVIMVESGGDPGAKAETSSANGLMQTVSGTFLEARKNLLEAGMFIPNDPFDPHASIMAGSWYLDRMFAQAASDQKFGVRSRSEVGSWRYPVEYYYAGPGNGKKKKNVVIIYAGGRRVVIDKPAYSKKVLKWARIMKKSG